MSIGIGREIAVNFVKWKLVDSSSPYFNVWECSAGYRESFWKNVNPNVSQKYGIDSSYIKTLMNNCSDINIRMVSEEKGYLRRD